MIARKLKRIIYRFRSAVTGRFVTKEQAERAPTRTVKERADQDR
jgi:hypothetical protein